MHAFDVLGDPVRRRILELLADGERTAGAVGAVVQQEFGISQPGVSAHLRVLRDAGFATVRPEGLVTLTGPLTTPAGTSTTSRTLEAETTCAGTPPMVTTLSPGWPSAKNWP